VQIVVRSAEEGVRLAGLHHQHVADAETNRPAATLPMLPPRATR
jgi:hypothetical protein